MEDLTCRVERILTPEICLAAYRIKFPFAKRQLPSGAAVGKFQFGPTSEYMQKFYDLIFHDAILPLSELPQESLLKVDLTKLLPEPNAPEYPENCLGMITILDQFRILAAGYGFRYVRCFFDPVCERLVRQLIALPADIRPDGKQAWLSRGYSIDDWLARTLWFWAPLVHSDKFMTADRQHLKDWLHSMRVEVESYAGVADPFAPQEAKDDVDITLFNKIQEDGPPSKSYSKPDAEASVADYAFWWIRILNAHFAITDMCGHYPYWVRWSGVEWSEKDREYMEQTNWFRYSPENEAALEQVKKDCMNGVWQPLEPNMKFEGGERENGHV